MIGGLIYINDNCNRCLECVKSCQSVTRWGDRVEKCKIDRYEKRYMGLERWEIKDRLNNGNRIVMVCDLPDDIAEEIMDYSLKLIEEEMK